MFLRLIEFFLIISGVLILVTQIILPLLSGRVMFPFFRERKYVAEYREVMQENEERELRKAIDAAKQHDEGKETNESAK